MLINNNNNNNYYSKLPEWSDLVIAVEKWSHKIQYDDPEQQSTLPPGFNSNSSISWRRPVEYLSPTFKDKFTVKQSSNSISENESSNNNSNSSNNNNTINNGLNNYHNNNNYNEVNGFAKNSFILPFQQETQNNNNNSNNNAIKSINRDEIALLQQWAGMLTSAFCLIAQNRDKIYGIYNNSNNNNNNTNNNNSITNSTNANSNNNTSTTAATTGNNGTEENSNSVPSWFLWNQIWPKQKDGKPSYSPSGWYQIFQ